MKLVECPYLEQRGISPDTAAHFGAGLCQRGHFKDYAVFPIRRYPLASADECPISYVGRWPGPDNESGKPRWKQFKDFPMSEHLFALNEAVADTASDEPIIVVEGTIDVLSCFEHGIKGTVAPVGAYLSDDQVGLLANTGRTKVIIMFDGDGSGQAAARDAATKVARRFWTRLIALPDGKDPADLGVKLRDIVLPAMSDNAHAMVFGAGPKRLAAIARRCWVKMVQQPLWGDVAR